MPEINLRPMEPGDIETCARLMAESPLWTRYGVTAASAAARFETGLSDGAALFVAESRGEVIGFIWCAARGAFIRSGYIPLIGVQPGQTGHGAGSALLAHAEAYLEKTSPDVFLLVSDFNTGARRFYERHGYRQAGALPDYLLPGVSELIYWKRLRA